MGQGQRNLEAIQGRPMATTFQVRTTLVEGYKVPRIRKVGSRCDSKNPRLVVAMGQGQRNLEAIATVERKVVSPLQPKKQEVDQELQNHRWCTPLPGSRPVGSVQTGQRKVGAEER